LLRALDGPREYLKPRARDAQPLERNLELGIRAVWRQS
jgi:hypothetical protein